MDWKAPKVSGSARRRATSKGEEDGQSPTVSRFDTADNLCERSKTPGHTHDGFCLSHEGRVEVNKHHESTLYIPHTYIHYITLHYIALHYIT